MGIAAFIITRRGSGPVVAAAVHHGHDTRPDVASRLKVDENQRLREEDPFTGIWTQAANTQIVGLRSRFEVDLNRPRSEAVYFQPADAWGLDVWNEPPSQTIVDASLHQYDAFHEAVERLLQELVGQYGRVVVYDLHTYNHRRGGVESAAAAEDENPEVNIGTGTMNREVWSGVVDRFIGDLRGFDFHGRSLDVRENVKFQGGHFGRWIHEKFPETVCAIAIEFKKTFMDEWTGEADLAEIEMIYHALCSTVAGTEAELR